MYKKNSSTLNTNAITPLDGRNYSKISQLSNYFSEYSLFKYRVMIEIKYLQQLSMEKIIPSLNNRQIKILNNYYSNFNDKDYLMIKKIEKIINHDVKSVEYFLRDKFIKDNLKDFISYIHLGLTSEDINNLSYGLILKNFNDEIVKLQLSAILNQLKTLANEWKHIPMLARTHGQVAVPTTVGKELINYYHRLKKQQEKLNNFIFEGKLNGAVGNYNALLAVFPKINWIKFSDKFISSLGLKPCFYTTQILFYDNWIEFFQIINLINGILIDLSINIWQYIMLGVLVQKKNEKEVGSSTMPQKINPINFEHAEGSLGFANSMFDYYCRKLSHSRLSRDLSDSVIRRTFGEAFGYAILGWQSIATGLNKININQDLLVKELEDHYEVLSEAIQTYLRSKNDSHGYEKLKLLSRGKQWNRNDYLNILKQLKITNKKLQELTPDRYIGLAKK